MIVFLTALSCLILFIHIHYKFLVLIVKSIKIYFKCESTEYLNHVFKFSILYIILSCIVFFIDLMILGSYVTSEMILVLDEITDNRFLSLVLYQYFTPIPLEELYGSTWDNWKNPESWAIIVHLLYMLILWYEIDRYYYTEDAIRRL